MGGIRIAIAKMGAQPIPERNGNRNRILNRICEWTLKVCKKHGNVSEIGQLSSVSS